MRIHLRPCFALLLTSSAATAAPKAPAITLIGEATIRLNVDHHASQYTDDGAICVDPVEGSISEKVIETGGVVHTARPGVYKLQYDCKNTAGVSAAAVTRTVIVSENYKPGCTKLVLSGRIPGQPHSDKVGVYRMMFTRCERNNGKEGGVNQGPDGRCVATAPSGSAIYRQDGGAHVLSYFDKFNSWVVDPTAKYRSLEKDDHRGLRLPGPGVNHGPEDSHSGWMRALKNGDWVPAKQLAISCDKKVAALPTSFDYKVTVPIKITGISVSQFTGSTKRGFIEAVADSLDIRNADIAVLSVEAFKPHAFPPGASDYGEANQLKHEGEAFGSDDLAWRRRRLEGIDADSEPAAPAAPAAVPAAGKPIEVVIEVTNTKKRLEDSIVPQITETMLGSVLKSEMIGQGLKVTAVDVESDLLSKPHLTTHAKIRLLAYVSGLFGLLVIVFTSRSIYQSLRAGKVVEDEGDGSALLKASSEEKRRLIATDAASAAAAAAANGATSAKGVAVEDGEPQLSTSKQVQVYLGWLMLAASTVGPGSVVVCSDVGANHGLNLVWCLGVASFVAYTLQEAAARMCIVSGMTFGRAMRFKFGAKLGTLPVQLTIATYGVAIGNSAYMCNNFASAMSSIGLLHDRTTTLTLISATLLAGMLMLTLMKGNVDEISRGLGTVVVVMTAVFACAAAQIGVEPETILYGMIPTVPNGAGVLALSVIGTTAIPFNLFLAASIAEGNTVKSMRSGMKLATCVAAVASMFIMIVGTGVEETSGAFTIHELGATLLETVGNFATKCFSFGLLAAAFSACIGATLGASVSIGGLNCAAGDDIMPGEKVPDDLMEDDELWGKNSKNAFRLVCWCTFVGWVTAALQLPTVPVVITAQVINGCLLPYLAYSLLVVINDPRIMAAEPQTAAQNVNGLIATSVTMMLASVVIITKFFGWAIPSEDHPIVFVFAFIMTVIGMDVVIRDVRKSRSLKSGAQPAREVVVAHDRLEFLSNDDAM